MSLIVIVDDRPRNRNIYFALTSALEPAAKVRVFCEPSEALDWLVGESVDLIIADFEMPRMDGADFIRAIRSLPGGADAPIIAVTVDADASMRRRAFEAGATDLLRSPIDRHEFLLRTRNLLKLRQHQLLLGSRAGALSGESQRSESACGLAPRDSADRLTQVIESLPALISVVDRDGRVLFANARQANFCGLDPATAVGRRSSSLLGAEHGARSQALERMVFDSGKALPALEEELIDHDGLKKVFLTTKTPLKDGADQVIAVVSVSLDVTARKRTEAHLRHLVHHDPLTDLPNGVYLRERIRRLLTLARRGDHPFAVHVLDIDRFKSVNDSFDRSIGDRLIRLVGERIRDATRDADLLARLGGDRFAIIQADAARAEDAADFARRILSTVAATEHPDLTPATLTASLGIAMHPVDGADGEDLLKHADLAMRRAKKEGGNHFCFYATDLRQRVRSEAALETNLRAALAGEQFVLFFQPCVDIRTRAVIGAEALLRWRRPDGGVVHPGLFLTHAEETGVIVEIAEWALLAACEEARKWQVAGVGPHHVSVNFSTLQFHKRSAPLLVAKALAVSGLDPRRLDLELTESAILRDLDAVRPDLGRLRSLGVRISIDDFAAGYSSLSYVKRLPIDRLKIDQSFVKNVCSDANDAAIIRAIATLGHSMELEVAAKGVESGAQAAALRAEGCDQGQGFYFGRPMPAEEFLALARGEAAVAKLA